MADRVNLGQTVPTDPPPQAHTAAWWIVVTQVGLVEIFVICERSIDAASYQESIQFAGRCPNPPPRDALEGGEVPPPPFPERPA